VGGTYEHPIGDKLFQDKLHRVAKFRDNWPSVSKNRWMEKKEDEKTRPKYDSLRYL